VSTTHSQRRRRRSALARGETIPVRGPIPVAGRGPAELRPDANHGSGQPRTRRADHGHASSDPYLIGGADAGPRVNVMGSGDRGQRVDAFGDSDLRFLDSLFTASGGAADRAGR